MKHVFSDVSDRVEASLLGSALGDALGYPVEFKDVRPDSPEVFGLEPGPSGFALFSDDTQMTVAVARGLMEANRVGLKGIGGVADIVARKFVEWSRSSENNRSPGGACMAGCYNLSRGVPWFKAGKPDGGGCGAAMRSAPYGWRFHDDWYRAATWAGEHALMTHLHPMAQASAAAVAAGVSSALSGFNPDKMAGFMVMAADMYDPGTAQMLREAIHMAHAGVSPEVVLDRWRGWAGHEAVSASLYCFLRHPGSFEDAVLMAVNSPGDSDSLGAITGALSGAFLGMEALPEGWLDVLEKEQFLRGISSSFNDTFDIAQA